MRDEGQQNAWHPTVRNTNYVSPPTFPIPLPIHITPKYKQQQFASAGVQVCFTDANVMRSSVVFSPADGLVRGLPWSTQ